MLDNTKQKENQMPKFEVWGTVISDIIIEVEATDRAAAWASLAKISVDKAVLENEVRAKSIAWNPSEMWQVLNGSTNQD